MKTAKQMIEAVANGESPRSLFEVAPTGLKKGDIITVGFEIERPPYSTYSDNKAVLMSNPVVHSPDYVVATAKLSKTIERYAAGSTIKVSWDDDIKMWNPTT